MLLASYEKLSDSRAFQLESTVRVNSVQYTTINKQATSETNSVFFKYTLITRITRIQSGVDTTVHVMAIGKGKKLESL